MISYQKLQTLSILDSIFRDQYKSLEFNDLLNYFNQKLKENKLDTVVDRTLRNYILLIEKRNNYRNFGIEFTEEKNGKFRIYKYKNPNDSIVKHFIKIFEGQHFNELNDFIGMFKNFPFFDALLGQFSLESENQDNKYIWFEQPELNDSSYLNKMNHIARAIRDKQPLRIEYRTFQDEEFVFHIHPYVLKQFNLRWYLFGKCHEYLQHKDFHNIPLDRIQKIDNWDVKFRPSNANFISHFENIYGVTTPLNEPLETVIVEFHSSISKYIISKQFSVFGPIKTLDNGNIIVTLQVYINYELERFLLMHCDKMKIHSPISLKEKIQTILHNGIKNLE